MDALEVLPRKCCGGLQQQMDVIDILSAIAPTDGLLKQGAQFLRHYVVQAVRLDGHPTIELQHLDIYYGLVVAVVNLHDEGRLPRLKALHGRWLCRICIADLELETLVCFIFSLGLHLMRLQFAGGGIGQAVDSQGPVGAQTPALALVPVLPDRRLPSKSRCPG